MGKKRLNKKQPVYEYLRTYDDILFFVCCIVVVFFIVCLFIGACVYFNVSFTDSGMVRNFLMGGV